MKKYLFLFIIIMVSCSKDEPAVTIPPVSNEIPPPSFTTTPFTPLSDFEYNGGDITIATREDFLKYRDLIVEEVSGDLNLNVDWIFYEGSSGDPSRFTSTIKEVTGNVIINTIDEFSMESLVKVGGDYSVTGADVIDDNLIYAQSISLDYDGDYVIKSVYTDAIELNLDDAVTAKAFINTSKTGSNRSVDIVAYHTTLIPTYIFDQPTLTGLDLETIRSTPPPMPEIAVYPSFQQTNSTEPSAIASDNISSITIGGHVNIEKITSESCTDITVNNTELPSIEVVSTSVVTFQMPFIFELVSMVLNLPGVVIIDLPLLVTIKTLNVTGVSEFLSPLLETITGDFTLVGVKTAGLPNLASLGGTSSLPSNVNLTTGSGAPTLDTTGTAVTTIGAATGSGTTTSGSGSSSSNSTTHDSGGSSTHDSGGSHNSGGSGG